MANSSNIDPQKLEGKRGDESSKAREFFWDSVTLYVVGIILALSALDAITQFIRSSSVSCYMENNETLSIPMANYINNVCALSLPWGQYFTVITVIQGVLIAIPHYLWLNYYGGNFEHLFSRVKWMNRTRDARTGEYSDKDYAIVQQLTIAFTTYKDNNMFYCYIIKLILQAFISLVALLITIFVFHDFKETFPCQRDTVDRDQIIYWPLDTSKARCVFTSLRLLGAIRWVDLILLGLLQLCFLWSFLWCCVGHPSELGVDKIASFCFETGMNPEHYNPPKLMMLRMLCSGPRICTNLDFLVLMLFRTESGLGFAFKEIQILLKLKNLNDDDHRRIKLHMRKIVPKSKDSKGLGRHDLKWIFEYKKESLETQESVSCETESVMVQEFVSCDHETESVETQESVLMMTSWGAPGAPFLTVMVLVHYFNYNGLIIMRTICYVPSMQPWSTCCGTVLGLSSLAPNNNVAFYITFGSISCGIPYAISRHIKRVCVLNFNPYIKQRTQQVSDQETGSKSSQLCSMVREYSTGIVHYTIREDILASEVQEDQNFMLTLQSGYEGTVDLIVVGPIDSERHSSTLSLFLTRLAQGDSPMLTNECKLLIITPKKLWGIESAVQKEFLDYVPPEGFKAVKSTVKLDGIPADSKWPPKWTNTNSITEIEPWPGDRKVILEDSVNIFTFDLYNYTPPERTPQLLQQHSY